MYRKMKPEPVDNHVNQTESLLHGYSSGEVDRRHVMRRLDVSYNELLEMLHERGLALPLVSDDEAKAMAATLNEILDAATVAA